MSRFAVKAALGTMVFGALAACGGGGGGDVTPSGFYRGDSAGDAWNYQVETINFGQFGSYSGTLFEGYTGDTYNGAASLRFTRTFNLNLSGTPATITSYEEISPSGELLAEEDNGALSAVAANTFSVPLPLSRSTNVTGSITLADGTSFAITYKVTGTAQVVTAAGIFNCWVVNQHVTHSDTTTDDYTIWIAPETGSYVRISDTTVNPDGSQYQYLASLTSIVTPANRPAGPGRVRPLLLHLK